eukprot:365620-Chlamydomonas_euryale.AAC.4
MQLDTKEHELASVSADAGRASASEAEVDRLQAALDDAHARTDAAASDADAARAQLRAVMSAQVWRAKRKPACASLSLFLLSASRAQASLSSSGGHRMRKPLSLSLEGIACASLSLSLERIACASLSLFLLRKSRLFSLSLEGIARLFVKCWEADRASIQCGNDCLWRWQGGRIHGGTSGQRRGGRLPATPLDVHTETVHT